jgi:hypothetical protein
MDIWDVVSESLFGKEKRRREKLNLKKVQMEAEEKVARGDKAGQYDRTKDKRR